MPAASEGRPPRAAERRAESTMAMMPKRMKYRKSQRGKIRERGPRAATRWPSASSACSRWSRLADRPGRSRPAVWLRPTSCSGRAGVHPGVPAQADLRQAAGNAYGQGQGRAGVLRRDRARRDDAVRDRRRGRGRGPPGAVAAWPTRCRSVAGSWFGGTRCKASRAAMPEARSHER